MHQMHPATERRCYNVTPSLKGRAQSQNDLYKDTNAPLNNVYGRQMPLPYANESLLWYITPLSRGVAWESV